MIENKPPTGEENMATETTPVAQAFYYEDEGHRLRKLIQDVALQVKAFSGWTKNEALPSNHVERLIKQAKSDEMLANSTLAFRHLEDARMRIGKAMQAYQGGESILDKQRREAGHEV